MVVGIFFKGAAGTRRFGPVGGSPGDIATPGGVGPTETQALSRLRRKKAPILLLRIDFSGEKATLRIAAGWTRWFDI